MLQSEKSLLFWLEPQSIYLIEIYEHEKDWKKKKR